MSEQDGFGIETVVEGDVATVSIRGELDLATGPALVKALRSAVAGGATRLIVDISGLSFVDSSGIGAFLEARKQLDASVVLRNPRGRVRKLLELVLIDSVIPIEYGPDEPDPDSEQG